LAISVWVMESLNFAILKWLHTF